MRWKVEMGGIFVKYAFTLLRRLKIKTWSIWIFVEYAFTVPRRQNINTWSISIFVEYAMTVPSSNTYTHCQYGYMHMSQV